MKKILSVVGAIFHFHSILPIVGSILLIVFAAVFGYCVFEKICPFALDSLDFEVDYQYRRLPAQEHFKRFEGDKKLSLRSGDFYQVSFKAKKRTDFWARLSPTEDNHYVYIFQVDDNNRVEQLFPKLSNDANGTKDVVGNTNPVHTDVSYDLLPKQLDDNIGEKTIYFLTLREPHEKLESLYQALPKTTDEKWQVKLVQMLKEIWQEQNDSLLTISVPVMSFTHEEKWLAVDVDYQYRADEGNEFQTLSEGLVLHSGDHYKIQFTPAEDSYVYVFQASTKNDQHEIFLLFPCFEGMKLGTNPVRANSTYYLPNETQWWFLDEQASEDKIYFLAFRTNMAMEAQYKKIDQMCEPSNVALTQDELLSFNLDAPKLQQNAGIFRNVLTFKHEN